jgi:hypothetical protein
VGEDVKAVSVAAAWLAYAREVVRDSTHRGQCALLGGSPQHPGVDATDLRWPGYLGAAVKRGSGVLMVGNIHRNFANGTVGVKERDRLVEVTRAWRDGLVDDQSYLTIVRDVYLIGLRGWPLGRQLRFAASRLGISLEEVTYLNAARCQYPEIPPALAQARLAKPALQRFCLSRFPISRVVADVEPELLLFTSVVAFDSAAESLADDRRLKVSLHQFTGQLTRPLQLPDGLLEVGTGRESWLPAVAETLQPAKV